MPRVEAIPAGAPIWVDLSTSDLDAAKAFYGGLFGWTFQNTGEEFGGYHMLSMGDAGIAGAMAKGPEEQGSPDAWTLYFGSDDAAATASKIREHGGQVLFEPMDVGDLGVMAIAVDPAGAHFGVWQPGQHTGFDLNNEAGAACWFEQLSRNFAASTGFFTKAFGVEIGDMPGDANDEGGPAYQVVLIDGQPMAGFMDASQGIMPDGVPSHWNVYWGVDDTDAAVAKAQELGGSVLAPAADTPWGRFAMLADTTGAAFCIISVGEDE